MKVSVMKIMVAVAKNGGGVGGGDGQEPFFRSRDELKDDYCRAQIAKIAMVRPAASGVDACIFQNNQLNLYNLFCVIIWGK